jgi:hypothetical protein
LGVTPEFTGREMPTAWLSNATWSRQTLGLPETDLATMERWVAAWLATGGATWGKPTGFEKRDGKF